MQPHATRAEGRARPARPKRQPPNGYAPKRTTSLALAPHLLRAVREDAAQQVDAEGRCLTMGGLIAAVLAERYLGQPAPAPAPAALDAARGTA